MTTLTSWHEADASAPTFQSSDRELVVEELKSIGVRYEYRSPIQLQPGATSEEILEAHRGVVEEISANENYLTVDVAQLHPIDDAAWREQAAAARAKFLNEHTHDDDEVRYFVQGSGVFYLHIGDRVHAVLCTPGDLLDVPAHTTHWFDMGATPDFTAIRFFKVDDGWIGNFTGSDIAMKFPDYDTLVAGLRTSTAAG